MRILLLSTYFRPDVASTGVIMSKLADEFAARGHEVTVLTSIPHYDVNRKWPEFSGRLLFTENAGSMRIYRIYTYTSKDRANILRRLITYASFTLLSVLRGATLPKHDVILVPSPPLSNGVIADFLSRLRKTPFVYNVQDIWPDVAIRAGVLKSKMIISCLRKMESYVYRRAARLTVISEGFRENLLAKGVPDEKIAVIPNFIDTAFVTPQPKDNAFSRKHNVVGKFVVLFAGNMGFSQGLEVVLDAANLLQEFSEIQFLMVGNGAGRNAAEKRLQTLGLSNVQFLPFQPYEDLPAMYGAADVCLIPLRRGFTIESVPCKLFTIMSAGRPAIASVDQGSDTWKLLQRTGCGICSQPEDAAALAKAIGYYYQHPDARTSAGIRARKCADEEFRPGMIADKYLEAMDAAVKSASKRVELNRDPVHL